MGNIGFEVGKGKIQFFFLSLHETKKIPPCRRFWKWFFKPKTSLKCLCVYYVTNFVMTLMHHFHRKELRISVVRHVLYTKLFEQGEGSDFTAGAKFCTIKTDFLQHAKLQFKKQYFWYWGLLASTLSVLQISLHPSTV